MLAFSGCIKDEPPNIEVDILDVVSSQEGVLTVVYHNDAVDVYVAPNVDPSELMFDIKVSEGAVIAPDPSEIVGYQTPRTFSVTSEDGAWTKRYTVRVRLGRMPTSFSFERWIQPERMRYMIPVEPSPSDPDDYMEIWACGNEAYNFLTNKNDDYRAFPTQPTPDAASGSMALMLVTRLTGQIDKPIAAGNLYLGQFDASLRDPRESTMFGLPFMSRPLRLKGKYKYNSGGKTFFSGSDDKCRIYAALYRMNENSRHLNGYSVKDSPDIVARAEIEDGSSTPGSGYVAFDLPFEYSAPVDETVLAEGGYGLVIVFSSSVKGDVYDGAPGSVLYIDDVEIVCQD